MHVGAIADTHDNVAAAEEAADVFENRGIGTVLHCGDYVAPPLLSAFEGRAFSLHGVLGNNDGELDGLEATIDGLGCDSELHGRFATFEFGGTRIHMLHGDQGMAEVNGRAESGEYDYVLYGHFHATECREVDGTTVVNPGAHFPTVPAENRSVAVIDTDADTVEFVDVEG